MIPKKIQEEYDKIVGNMEKPNSIYVYAAIVKNKLNKWDVEYGYKPHPRSNGFEVYKTNEKNTRADIEKTQPFFIDSGIVDPNAIKNKESFEGGMPTTGDGELLSINDHVHRIPRKELISPIKGGLSIGNYGKKYKSGTLGGLFTVNNNNKIYFLTCYHNLTNNVFKINSPNPPHKYTLAHPSNKDYHDIYQVYNAKPIGNCTSDTAAFDGSIDAIIGEMTSKDISEGVHNFLSKIPQTHKVKHQNIGDPVRKQGRSSLLTSGKILSVQSAVRIKNENYSGQKNELPYVVFKDQIMTDKMAIGGDSGSSLFVYNGEPQQPAEWKIVGLTFAKIDFKKIDLDLILNQNVISNSLKGRTFHNKIDNIIKNQKLFGKLNFKTFL